LPCIVAANGRTRKAKGSGRARRGARRRGSSKQASSTCAGQPIPRERDVRVNSGRHRVRPPLRPGGRPAGPEHNRALARDGRALEGDAAPSPRPGDGFNN